MALNKRRTVNLESILLAAQNGFEKRLTLHEFRQIWNLVPNFYKVVPCSDDFVIQAIPAGSVTATLEERLKDFTRIINEKESLSFNDMELHMMPAKKRDNVAT